MAFLAIDWGEKRIGMAVGTIYPKPAGIIDGSKPISEIADEIKEICLKNDIEKLIIGLPMRLGGEEGHLAPKIRNFADVISKETGLESVFEPEQFTSAEAEEFLRSHNVKYTRESGVLDETAAVLILEQYINKEKNENSV